MARHWARTGKTLGGPDWFDLNVQLRDLGRKLGGTVELCISSSASRGELWGVRVEVRLAGNETVLGFGYYGPLHPTGSKTMEGACYSAIWQCERFLALHDDSGLDLGSC